jgi:hypothetical protein
MTLSLAAFARLSSFFLYLRGRVSWLAGWPEGRVGWLVGQSHIIRPLTSSSSWLGFIPVC